MKNIIFITLILVSCSTDNDVRIEENLPYYEFSNTDLEKLLSVYQKKEEIVTFQNQYNNKLRFKVTYSKKEKVEYRTGTLWSSYTWVEFYHDRQLIELELLENSDDNEKIRFITVKWANAIQGGINFPLYNDYSSIGALGRDINIDIDYSASLNQMFVNEIFYEKVIEFNSESEEAPFYFGSLKRNVNKIFYDLNNGVIGFNDLDNNKWRIVN